MIFSMLKMTKMNKIRVSQEATILSYSCHNFVNNLQTNNYKIAFDQLKKIFYSSLKSKKDSSLKSSDAK